MKKLIITAAIALTAAFSFITYQNKAVAHTNTVASEKLMSSNTDNTDFAPVRGNRMDIGQADVK